jgi:glycosyltransferase involved in cell wall biosynthesis
VRVAQIVPGSGGGFYCQNCLRDTALVTELRAQGHDVMLVPMYLPLLSDDQDLGSGTPVFYGAVKTYLKQQLRFLRRAPKLLDRLLDSRPMLALAARMAGSTRASGLEEMTISMLQGEHGAQAEELDHLVTWLRDQERPHAVHLSNGLLLGLAHKLKQALQVPILCSLQDEHHWIDAMGEPHATRIWNLMAETSQSVDGFIAVSRYYAELMTERLRLAPGKVHVVPIGIDPSGYQTSGISSEAPAIGYLSRMCESLGLGTLVDAFILLRQDQRLGQLKLKVMGGRTGDDARFLARTRKRLQRAGLLGEVELSDGLERAQRIRMLGSISVLSVPVAAGEAFGTYLLEAMAAGVPVVQPEVGAFPELIEATGGGITYRPNSAEALAEALRSLLLDPERARQLGRSGQQAISRELNVSRMAERTIEVYQHLTGPATGS